MISPPTYKLPPIPTPPITCRAPVTVEVAAAVFVILMTLVVVEPLLVKLCSVLVFHTVTIPVDVLTAVSVPASIVLTAYKPIVAVVRIKELLI